MRTKFFWIVALLWAFCPDVSHAVERKAFVIDGYTVRLANGADGNRLWGWIELYNATEPAGIVYLTEGELRPPHFSADRKIIIMDAPLGMMADILDLLRNEAPLQIRFEDLQSSGAAASVFLEPAQASDFIIQPQTAMENAPSGTALPFVRLRY